MVDIGELIHVYDNSLDTDVCDSLIATFDESLENHEVVKGDGKPNFTQFNLTKNSDKLSKVHKHLIKTVQPRS